MRRILAVLVVIAASQAARAGYPLPRVPRTADIYRSYSPAYGYSDRPNFRGGGYGNSAPFQGNFSFPPGFGYGSIYGNNGHPGFRSYGGPSWAYPQAWGR